MSYALCLGVFAGSFLDACAATARKNCQSVVIEGEVAAGQSFDRVFTKSLRFYLEPLRSGWIVRVLDANGSRESHDYAELATPPYQSVSPLLISTDWAFRAQDAVAWNPRNFRFAGNRPTFLFLEKLLPGALSGNQADAASLADLVSHQPEGQIVILDSRFAPGTADQARMASTVALHLAATPHAADTAAPPTPLGKLELLHFRVFLQVPESQQAAKGLELLPMPCGAEPTSANGRASHNPDRRKPK